MPSVCRRLGRGVRGGPSRRTVGTEEGAEKCWRARLNLRLLATRGGFYCTYMTQPPPPTRRADGWGSSPSQRLQMAFNSEKFICSRATELTLCCLWVNKPSSSGDGEQARGIFCSVTADLERVSVLAASLRQFCLCTRKCFLVGFAPRWWWMSSVAVLDMGLGLETTF